VAYPELGDYARTRILSPTGKPAERREGEGTNLVVGQIVGCVENAAWKTCSWGNYESSCPRSAEGREKKILLLLGTHSHAYIRNSGWNNFHLELFALVKRGKILYFSSSVFDILYIILFDILF